MQSETMFMIGSAIWNRAFWVRKTSWIWKYVKRCLEGTIGMGKMLFLGNISLQYRDWKIPPLMRKVWCSNPSRDRPEVAKKGSDNSTAKRSATGVRVRGPWRWPLSTDAVCHSRCARLKTIVLSLIAKIQWNNHLQTILCKLIIRPVVWPLTFISISVFCLNWNYAIFSWISECEWMEWGVSVATYS